MRLRPKTRDKLELLIIGWLASYGVVILRVALGVVFFWFGVLKYFEGLSPAQELAAQTVEALTFGLVGEGVGLILVGTLECAIGVGLITRRFMRLTLLLLAFQLVGASSPLFLFPGETFTHFPYAPTLEGQ